MKRPAEARVSVIMPVYNQAGFLAECLDTVLAQTLREIEVVCVDDGSTDGSRRILEEYAARDARVKAVSQRNLGPGAARNRGMDVATGEFVAFMDPDDMYPDIGVLEDLYSAAASSGANAAGGSFSEFLPGGAERCRYDGSASGMSFDEDGMVDYRDWQFDHGFVRFVFRRTVLEGAKARFPGYRRYQDPPFFVRAMDAAGSFFALRRVAYRCRVRAERVDWSACGAMRFRALCAGLRDVAVFARRRGYGRLLSLQRQRTCRDFGAQFFDWRLRYRAPFAVARLCRALGALSLSTLERMVDAEFGPEPDPVRIARHKGPRAFLHPERSRETDEAAEAILYAGDLGNFGKAYADEMSAIRKGCHGKG